MIGAYILDYADYGEYQNLLAEAGIDSLVFEFATPSDVLNEALEHFTVYLEFKPFATDSDKRFFVEDASGGRKDLEALGCPSNRGLWERNLYQLESKLSELDVSGVFLDFVRFPSPANKEFFFSCFCSNCIDAANALGYDLDAIKAEITSFNSPSFNTWLRFKQDIITAYVTEFSRRIKPEKGAFLFSPSIAPLVGQDYARLSPFLDMLLPMLYPEGSLGPACLGYEIYHFAELFPNASLKEIYSYLALESRGYPLNPASLRAVGLPDEAIVHESAKAAKQAGDKIFPTITVIDTSPAQSRERVEMASQFGGIFLFGFSPKYKENFLSLGVTH